jgi:tellurite resistance protein
MLQSVVEACAVYANATGQADAARQLAEVAAQSKPECRDQIGLLFGR